MANDKSPGLALLADHFNKLALDDKARLAWGQYDTTHVVTRKFKTEVYK